MPIASRLENAVAKRVQIDDCRYRDHGTTGSTQKRQHNARIEGVFCDTMSQRIPRHPSRHSEQAERCKAKERVPRKSQNGDDQPDGNDCPDHPCKEGQPETGTAILNLHESGNTGHDRKREDRETEGHDAKGEG